MAEEIDDVEPLLLGPMAQKPGSLHDTNYVILLHPGVGIDRSFTTTTIATFSLLDDNDNNKRTSSQHGHHSASLSSISVTFRALIDQPAAGHTVPVSLYIYDTSSWPRVDCSKFFGGVHIQPQKNETGDDAMHLDFVLEPIELLSLKGNKREHVIDISSGNSKQWTIVIVAQNGTYSANLTFILASGAFVLLMSVCLALCLNTRMRRAVKIAEIAKENQQERA